MKINHIIYFILFLVFSSLEGIAQINIKVGYRAAYTDDKVVNDIVARYNAERPWFDEKLGEIHISSGLELGVRYKFGATAFEIGWSSVSAEAEGFGTQPSGSAFTKDLKSGLREYHLGLESHLGVFGFGASIDSRRLKFETKLNNFDKLKVISSSSALASKFYLLFQLQSQRVSLTLKPFVQYALEPFNINGLDKAFFPDSTRPVSDFDTDWTVFGLSVVFYNGQQ